MKKRKINILFGIFFLLPLFTDGQTIYRITIIQNDTIFYEPSASSKVIGFVKKYNAFFSKGKKNGFIQIELNESTLTGGYIKPSCCKIINDKVPYLKQQTIENLNKHNSGFNLNNKRFKEYLELPQYDTLKEIKYKK